MTNIEQLILDLCPNGVEFKYLTDVANVLYGYPFEAEKFSEDESNIPLIRIRDVVPAKASTYYTGTYPKEYIIKAGDILVGMDGNFNLEKWKDRDGLLNQRVCKIYSKNADAVLDNFLYHLLKPLFKKIEDEIKGGTVKHLSAARIKQIEIPIPPLEIQKKIVECLDKFSALAAELQAELQKRRTQYEYYRTRLLTPPPSESNSADNADDAKWEWKTLGEVCVSIKDGMHNLPESSLIETDYPIISAQNIYDNKIDYVAKRYVDEETFVRENKRTNVEVGDVLLTIVATIGRSAVVKEARPVLLQRSVCVLKPNKDIYPEFLKFSLDTNRVQSYMIANAHGAAQAGLYLNQVEQIKVALPPFTEQKRIADLLGKFDKLITSMEEGLPAEMDRQQKRYEYYRDLLLTFEKK